MSAFASYPIDDLLALLVRKRGQRLLVSAGLKPSLFVEPDEFEVEGPAITPDVAEELLRKVADSRHVREFREHHKTDFIYKFRASRFVVSALITYGAVQIDFQRLQR